MERPGVISRWNDDKGFGFIQPQAGEPDVFLHISSFNGEQRPRVGDPVLFTLGQDAQGRPRAARARLAQEAPVGPADQPRPSRQSRGLPILLAATGVLPLGVTLQRPALMMFWLAYAVFSPLTYLAYWDDKRRAQRGAWRTSEAALHLLELLGGWPGALIAQQRLRHKNRKLSFQFVFWFIVLIHQFCWLMWMAAPRST